MPHPTEDNLVTRDEVEQAIRSMILADNIDLNRRVDVAMGMVDAFVEAALVKKDRKPIPYDAFKGLKAVPNPMVPPGKVFFSTSDWKRAFPER